MMNMMNMMKKKILAILMTALMVVSLIPMFAFTALADTHELTVTKNGEAAEEDTDYSWSGTTLTIKTDGLTVSGSTSTEMIRFDASVKNLTIEGLSIMLSSEDSPIITNGETFTLTLVGDNTLSTAKNGYAAVQSYSSELTITGTGNLIVSGENGIVAGNKNIILFKDCGKVIARAYGETGNALRAINGTIKLENVIMKGSTNQFATEEQITGDIEIVNGYVKIGDKDAKSVLIQPIYNVKVSDIKNGKVEVDKEKAAKGETVTLTATPNENYKLASLKVTDADGKEVKVTDNKFVMPASNVTVTAEFTVKEATPKTGDVNNMLLWIVIALAAISLTTCTVLRVKRTNK